ncbi:hypothetical protein [Mammaliicoccus sciuri]|uniref:hypothetical protein n=1 Tax=Mammaliicoccus sciuri TaxID=1296 RepID=UPI0019528527|nr:hypothetical protein [Mammaliicoccus sciuri]
MEEIKYLFIGKEPFAYRKNKDKNKESTPKYTNIQLTNYPTKNVAFFPKFNSDNETKNPLEIHAFRRILGILYNTKVSKDDDFIQKFGKENPKNLARHLQEKGIYFCNLNELKDNKYITLDNNNNNNDNYKWLIGKNTKLLCFGSDPINEITEIVIDNNLPLENLSTFPHPAKNNSHIIWQHYDKNFTPTTYNLKLKNLPDLNTLK